MANAQQTYQWCFSLFQLEMVLVLLAIWTFGIWITWLHARHDLSNRGKYDVPQEFKAALYLADSIRADLKEVDQEVEFLTNKELGRHADGHLKRRKSRNTGFDPRQGEQLPAEFLEVGED